MENFGTVKNSYHDHDMISHDVCHEVIQPTICHDSCHDEEHQLNKSDWRYLVNQLEQWNLMMMKQR